MRCGFLWRKVKIYDLYTFDNEIGTFKSIEEAKVYLKLIQ